MAIRSARVPAVRSRWEDLSGLAEIERSGGDGIRGSGLRACRDVSDV